MWATIIYESAVFRRTFYYWLHTNEKKSLSSEGERSDSPPCWSWTPPTDYIINTKPQLVDVKRIVRHHADKNFALLLEPLTASVHRRDVRSDRSSTAMETLTYGGRLTPDDAVLCLFLPVQHFLIDQLCNQSKCEHEKKDASRSFLWITRRFSLQSSVVWRHKCWIIIVFQSETKQSRSITLSPPCFPLAQVVSSLLETFQNGIWIHIVQ